MNKQGGRALISLVHRLPPWLRVPSAVLLLCALSLLALGAPQRYAALPQGPGLVAMSDLAAWRRVANGASLLPTQAPTLRLQARGERLVWAFRPLWPLNPSLTVRISAELRGEDLAGAYIRGGAGQFIAQSLDRRHRRIPNWPYRVGGIDGSQEWHHVRLVVPGSETTAGLQLVAFVAADSGTLELRNPRVEVVNERALFSLARYLMLAAWLATWAWCAWRLMQPGPGRLPRSLLACSATLALVAALAPPPHINQFVKRVLIGSQDVVYELAAAIPDGNDTVRAVTPDATDGAQAASAREQGAVAPLTAHDEDAASAAAAGHATARREADKPATTQHPRSYWMPPNGNLDKPSHLAGFAMLALLAAVAFRRRSPWRVLPAMALLAVSIETLQGFTIMREPDVLDLRADLLGAVAGVSTAWLASRVWRLLTATRRAPG